MKYVLTQTMYPQNLLIVLSVKLAVVRIEIASNAKIKMVVNGVLKKMSVQIFFHFLEIVFLLMHVLLALNVETENVDHLMDVVEVVGLVLLLNIVLKMDSVKRCHQLLVISLEE